jgi:hypothetical protein
MPQYAVELIDTGQVSVGDGKVTIRRAFVMWPFASEALAIRGLKASYNTGPGESTTTTLPYIGAQHPDWRFMRAHSYNMVRHAGSGDDHAWRVEFEYRNVPNVRNAPPTPTGLPSGPDAISFEELTAKVSGSFILAYRANPMEPVDNVFGEESGDIGGTPCDAGGQPTSQMRYQYEITKSIVTEQNFEDSLGSYGAQVGTRGGGFGMPSGSLLYRGAQIQRIEANKYRVQHTYLYDSNKHCIQVPRYNKDGLFDLDEDGHVDIVYWKQPFPSSSDALPGV